MTRVSDLVRVSRPRRHHCPLHAAVTVARAPDSADTKSAAFDAQTDSRRRRPAGLAGPGPLSVASVATPGPARPCSPGDCLSCVAVL